MAVNIASEVSSLASQRRLGEATYALRKVSENLSSGLRIRRAADDLPFYSDRPETHDCCSYLTPGICSKLDSASRNL